jgi:hypothetical protein
MAPSDLAESERVTGSAWRRWSIVVLLAGLTGTAAGAAATWRLAEDSKERLLEQQTREAAAVLTVAIGRLETALSNAAVLAEATSGDAARFRSFADSMSDSVGLAGAQLVSADGSVVAAGGPQSLVGPAERADDTAALLDEARADPGRMHVALVEGSARRLAYTIGTAGTSPLVVYAESPLPDRPTRLERTDGPFSNIDYALHLGPDELSGTLLYGTVDDVPVDGPKSVVTIPFGDDELVFAARAAAPLAGRFTETAPWLIVAVGALASIAAAAATWSVVRRGRAAEQLAVRLAAVTGQQRAGIDTLRRSLLPRRLVVPDGITVHTGYWPADRDHEVSGDFYDVFQVDERRWAVAIGDVCGHGVDAAALTGLTRHTIRAAARHLRSPAEVLRWTHEALAAESGTTYVTVCFAFVDVLDDGSHQMRVSLGGHPRPALWRDGTVRFVGTPGTLLGLVEPRLTSEVVALEPGDVVVLYTDGVTDAAEAPLDEPELGAVIASTLRAHDVEAAPAALRSEVRRRRPGGSDDDSAVLMIQAVHRHRPADARVPLDVGASGRDAQSATQ